jgi:hypothetical protein
MRPRYPHRKLIKIDYEAQFSTDPILNDKIKKWIYDLLSDHLSWRQYMSLQ